jgi:biotin transporter BioY
MVFDSFSVDARALRRYAIGDIAAIAVFVVLGEFSHGENPVTVFWPMLETLGTFLLGWIVVATIAGAYSERSLENGRHAILVSLFAWAIADAIAQLLRTLSFVRGNGAITFYLVGFVVGGALIGAWRYVAFRFTTKESPAIER